MSCDVAVVGAGIAGLTAADVLTRAGVTVTVLEARERVGGRAFSIDTGLGVVDLGPSWFWPDESLVRSLCDGLAVDTFSQHTDGDALFEGDGSGPQRLAGNPIDAPASRFAAGAQALANAIAGQLPAAMHLGQPVSAVQIESGHAFVHARTVKVEAQQVIVAVPPALAVQNIAFTPDLPPDLLATAGATEVWMAGMVKAVAVYDHAFWRDDGLAGSGISYAGPFREFHDLSGPGGIPPALFGFAPAERLQGMQDGDIGNAFVHQLGRMFGAPALTPREVHVLDWSREPFTCPHDDGPARHTSTYGAQVFQQAAAGRIHFASTETATSHAGHIEGAIRAGVDAARRVLGAA